MPASTPSLTGEGALAGDGVSPADEAPPQDPSTELGALVAADQIRLLYARSPFIHASGVVVASLYAFVVRNDVPVGRNLLWLALVAATASGRIVLRHAYFRAPRGPDQTARWRRRWVLGGALYGASWGSSALVAFPVHSPTSQTLQTILVAATIGVAGAYNASHLAGYFAFSIPAAVPVLARHLALADPLHLTLALVLLLFVSQIASVPLASRRSLRENAQLRIRLELFHRALEQKVAQRSAELQAALAARDELIWVTSHELRTPLTSLMLSAQNANLLLRADPAVDPLARSILTTLRQGRQLGRVIDTVFDTARIESGSGPLNLRDDVDLRAIVRESAARLKLLGSRIRVEAPSRVVGRWDAERLARVVSHLLSHATVLEHPVRVRVEMIDDTGRMTIEQEGEQEGDAVAEGERRTHAGSRREGFELGLDISRLAIERFGGALSVEGTPERGWTLTMRLPCSPPA